MHLADHIRPLLRDHDCVIIPDFGGLVAEAAPARLQAGRQSLSPPSKFVAFNAALTRNDGLLVDCVAQHLHLSLGEARERVREAVAALQQELHDGQRTELPGIGVFRRVAGRGLAFEYTGTDNLLPAAYGLPTVAARPVRATDAQAQRQQQRPRPQPALRGSGRRQWARVLPGATAVLGALALVLAAGFFFTGLSGRTLLSAWQARLPRWEMARPGSPTATPTATLPEPQQAALAHHDWVGTGEAAPLTSPASAALAPAAPLDSAAANGAAATDFPALAQVAAADPDATALPATSVAPATPAASAALRPAAVARMPAPRPGTVAAPAPGPATAGANAAVANPPAAPVEAAAAASPTIKARTGRYFVIAGAYSSLAHAEVGRRVLARTGHPARVILPFYGSRLFRLTAGEFATAAEAETEAQRLRQTTHCDYNTLKF